MVCFGPGPRTIPSYGIRGMLAYRTTLLRINLQHAPVVRFWYVGIDPTHVSADIDYARVLDDAEVWGIRLPPNDCTEGYGRGTTTSRTP